MCEYIRSYVCICMYMYVYVCMCMCMYVYVCVVVMEEFQGYFLLGSDVES